MRASVLALLLLAGPAWGASRAVPASRIDPASRFDAGRRAFGAGRYEEALHELMLALMARPDDVRVRELMRRAGESLIAADERKLSRARRALLEDYRAALEVERRRAERWNAWLLQANAGLAGGRFSQAFDDSGRVLEDNPLHAEAKAAQRRARLGLTRAIGTGKTLAGKDRLVYRGLFSFVSGRPERARAELADALKLEGPAELEDDRIRHYLALVTPVVPAPAPAPEAETLDLSLEPSLTLETEKRAKPKRVVRRRRAPARAPIARPGEAALAQGLARLEEGSYDEAVELLERSLGEAPGSGAAQSALVKARLGREERRARGKADAERLYAAGLLLYGQGLRAQAVAQWKKAVAADPDHAYAARALSHAEQELREEEAR